MNVVFITLISLSVALLCSASTDEQAVCAAGEPSIDVKYTMTLDVAGTTQNIEIPYDLTLTGKTSEEVQSVIEGLFDQHGTTTVITCTGGLQEAAAGSTNHCEEKSAPVCDADSNCDDATTDCEVVFGCYMCKCKTGFNTATENTDTGKIQCEADPVECEPDSCNKAFQTCDTSSGSVECICEEGYERTGDNEPCIPVLDSDCQTLLNALTPTNIPDSPIQSTMTDVAKYEEYYAVHRRVPLELYEDGMCTDATVNNMNPVALTAAIGCQQVESYKAFKMAFAAADGDDEVELFELSTGYQIFKVIECDEACSFTTLTCTQTRTRHQALVVDDSAVVYLRDVYLPGGCELRLTTSP